MPAPPGIGFINANGPQAYNGGNASFQLTPAMTTTPQLVKGGAGRVCRLHNTQGGSCSVTVYDAGSQDATTLSTATIIYKGTLPTAAPLDLQYPVTQGIVIAATSTVANVVLLTYI